MHFGSEEPENIDFHFYISLYHPQQLPCCPAQSDK